jgi:Flp pilus assembly protein TadD
MFKTAVAARPHDAELALTWAGFESRSGDLAHALALTEQVLAATPDAAGALNQVGFTLVELKRDLPRARELLARARRLSPGDASVLDSWGWLLRAEGDLPGADRALTRAVLIAPHEPEILLHAATIASERGAGTRARRLYALALARPSTPEVHLAAQLALAPGGAPQLPACYARVHMKASVFLRVLAGPLLAMAACADTPSKGQCDQLLAHIIDLEATAGGVKGAKDDVEKQKASVKEYAIGQKFIEACTRDTPKKVVACGLAAKNMDEIAACDGAK